MKKVLYVMFTLMLLTGCSTKLDDDKIKEISITDEKVVEIAEKFRIVRSDNILYTYAEISDGLIYINEGLSDSDFYEISRINSNDVLKKDKNCAEDKYCKADDCYYQCEYIEYEDYNKEYKSLTGKDLPKSDIDIDLVQYVYDSENNVYRKCMYYGGGGSDLILANKLIKAEQDGDYIYIYEKVGFVWPNSNGYIIRKHNGTKVNVEKNNASDSIRDVVINNHLDNLDIFKWTFKKDSNGEYIYESLKYIEQ